MKVKTYASLMLYIGAVLCFFLPFATVSCGGMHVITFTGQQLATGTHVTQAQMFGPPKLQNVPADPFASGAALIGIIGLIISVIGRKMGARFNLMTAWIGVLGFIDMLFLKSHLADQIQKQSQGVAKVEWLSGYTWALLFFLVAAAWSACEHLSDRKKRMLEKQWPKTTISDSPEGGAVASQPESV